MAKPRILESDIILKVLNIKQVSALNYFRTDKKFADLVGVINQIILTDKEKIVGLSSDIKSVDDALEKTSKQNFYRGRIASLVLLHSLLINAEKELDIRERKDK